MTIRISLIYVLLAITIVMVSARLGQTRKKFLIGLGDGTFTPYRQKHPQLLAMFMSPWCGRCKRIKPYFVQGNELSNDLVPFVIVDCTVSRDTCNTYGIRSYPTIKFFSSSTDPGQQYMGDKSPEGFFSFVKTQMQKLNKAAYDEWSSKQ